jgi:hypothetical protein
MEETGNVQRILVRKVLWQRQHEDKDGDGRIILKWISKYPGCEDVNQPKIRVQNGLLC